MKLQFLRFENEVVLSDDSVATLQVEDRLLFSRMVQSLVSGLGEQACEPYCMWDDSGKKVPPRKAFFVVDALPQVPLSDRSMLGKLYAKLEGDIDDGTLFPAELDETFLRLRQMLESSSVELWGRYEFGVDWSPALFLKAFGFQPVQEDGDTLLDNCIRFFELCVDIGFDKPVILVNAKSFFGEKDLSELFSQAIFHGIPLMLIESWSDGSMYENERKMVIDQDFLETYTTQSQSDDRPLQQDFAPTALEQRQSDW